MDGDELNLADTGDELWEETAKFARLWASLDAIFPPDGIEDEAHLLRSTAVAGVVGIAGAEGLPAS